MIPKYISWVVYTAASLPKKQEKIEFLRRYYHPILRDYLKMATTKELEWALPPGAPPYTCKKEAQQDSEFVLYNEFKWICRVFLKGNHPTLKDRRREQMFVSFIEGLHEQEAKFFIEVVKDKKLPKGLTEKILKEAWPGAF